MKRFICQLAAALRRAGFSISQAFKRAWYATRLRLRMMSEGVRFCYKKEDGTYRWATGSYVLAPDFKADQTSIDPYSLVVRYFDLTCTAWRSFRIDRLVLPA